MTTKIEANIDKHSIPLTLSVCLSVSATVPHRHKSFGYRRMCTSLIREERSETFLTFDSDTEKAIRCACTGNAIAENATSQKMCVLPLRTEIRIRMASKLRAHVCAARTVNRDVGKH